MFYKNIMIVLASRNYIYDNFVKYYWIPFINFVEKKKNNNELKIILLYGNENTNDLDIPNKNVMKVNIKDSYIPGCLVKTISSFEYINKNFEYEKIIRTNISSFFIYDNLIQHIDNLPKENLYCGIINEYGDVKSKYYNINYVSGACFILSKNFIGYIIENKNKIDLSVIDDVSIGVLLSNYKIINGNRFDITNLIEIPKENDRKNYLEEIIKNKAYHIRLKNPNRMCDIVMAKYFTDFFYQK